jgi:hypothetical protein
MRKYGIAGSGCWSPTDNTQFFRIISLKNEVLKLLVSDQQWLRG